MAFLVHDAKEILYGGAAGGGKSDALLMAALEYVDTPGYAALLLRKTFADLALPGALMARSHEWLSGTAARWNSQQFRWTFPSGSTVSFGYLNDANAHYRYQSSEFQFIGFDELTQFQEYQYRYLFSRLRRIEGLEIPLRMRAGSNPGGIGHGWVFDRFIDVPPTDERVFIPATLDENPYLDRDAYEASLSELDEVERARLRHGNWHVKRAGLVFPDLEDRFLPEHPTITDGWAVGGIDFGWHNPFAALGGVVDHDGVLWITSERYGSQVAVSDHAKHLPPGVQWFADPAGADQTAELRKAGHNVRPCVHLGQQPLQHGIGVVNRWIKEGRVKISPRCRNLRKEAGLYHYDKQTETPVDQDNHALSALRYLIVSLERQRRGDMAQAAAVHNQEILAATVESVAAEQDRRDPFNDQWWN